MKTGNVFRIKQLREALGLRQDELAWLLGYKQGSMSYIEGHDSRITDRLTQRIKEVLPGINIDFIRTGEGPIFKPSQEEPMRVLCRDFIANGGVKISGNQNSTTVNAQVEQQLDLLKKELELVMRENESLRREIEAMGKLMTMQDKTINWLQDMLIDQKKKDT